MMSPPPTRRALALISVLLATLLLSIIAFATASASIQRLWTDSSGHQREQALWAAETAARLTIRQLVQNSSFTGLAPTQLNQTKASYQSSVTLGPATAPNGLAVPDGLFYLLGEGSYGGQTRRVGLMLSLSSSTFPNAAFGADSIKLSGASKIDNWDSTVGDYPAGSQPGQANVGTNSALSKSIVLEQGSTIDGTLFVAPGSPPDATSLLTGSSSTGGQATLTALRPLPPVVLPSDPSSSPALTTTLNTTTLAPGVYGDVTINSSSKLILAEGTYVFKSLTIRLGSELVIPAVQTNPTKLFIQDALAMAINAQLNNLSKKASLLNVQVQNGPVSLASGSDNAYLVLYAPGAAVSASQGGHFFGSIVGKTIGLNVNSAISYDLALGSASGGATTATVLSRQEF